MKKVVEFLDEEGFLAAAVLGLISLISMPVTYGEPLFDISTWGVIIAVGSLLFASFMRFFVALFQRSPEKLSNK